MAPVLAFTIVMAVWVFGEFVSSKTNAIISMMLVASIVFLVGFSTGWLPDDLIERSGFLHLGNAVIGLIIVHLGTMMSLKDLKDQWRTFVIGASTVVLISVIGLFVGQLIFDRNIAVAGTAAITGGTLSILMVQGTVADIQANGGDLGILSPAILQVFPLLMLSFKNLVGFLITAGILKREAKRLHTEYLAGNLSFYEDEVKENHEHERDTILPKFLQTTYGTLFVVGLTVYVSMLLSNLTQGYVNTFVIALLMGIFLRHFRILQANVLTHTDTFGLLMISIMVIAFGPLADITPADLLAIAAPLAFYLISGVLLVFGIAFVIGTRLGYSGPLSIGIGLSMFFGFPGTMVLTKEAAAAVAETDEEREVIEQRILPIMITAGFSTITITSVLIGGILVGFMVG